MDLDPLLISRLQFAFTIIFHIIFPTFTIGLSAYIATLCVMWMRTGKQHYRVLARFWTKIFAVSFAMGVVSGIVLSYQFGTNWSRIKDNIPDKVDIEWFKQGGGFIASKHAPARRWRCSAMLRRLRSVRLVLRS
jgi:cytochrome b subunit of formate dehydrogenase